MTLPVLVIVSPRVSKEFRVYELVQWVSEQVKEHEPDVSMYHYSRTEGEDGDGENLTDYVIYMIIEDEEALAKRRELKHHQEIAGYIKDEDLLRRPLRYMPLRDGHDWHR